MGWEIVGDYPRDIQKYVIIGAPHTSYYDFIIGILVRNILEVEINFIAKAALFKPPFGFIFRNFGGIPVDRTKSNNLVEAIIAVFNSKESFKLALSPEGTRKEVGKWKTGFYYMAKGANVPVVMFVFGKKQVTLSEPFYTTDDMDADIKKLQSFYKGVQEKTPKYS